MTDKIRLSVKHGRRIVGCAPSARAYEPTEASLNRLIGLPNSRADYRSNFMWTSSKTTLEVERWEDE